MRIHQVWRRDPFITDLDGYGRPQLRGDFLHQFPLNQNDQMQSPVLLNLSQKAVEGRLDAPVNSPDLE